jgi:threonine aldolase
MAGRDRMPCAHEAVIAARRHVGQRTPPGIQFHELFGTKRLFFTMGRHANAMAEKLASGISSAGYQLSAKSETNEAFPILPDTVLSTLQGHFAFCLWEKHGADSSVIRLVASRATEERHVDAFMLKLPMALEGRLDS